MSDVLLNITSLKTLVLSELRYFTLSVYRIAVESQIPVLPIKDYKFLIVGHK